MPRNPDIWDPGPAIEAVDFSTIVICWTQVRPHLGYRHISLSCLIIGSAAYISVHLVEMVQTLFWYIQ